MKAMHYWINYCQYRKHIKIRKNYDSPMIVMLVVLLRSLLEYYFFIDVNIFFCVPVLQSDYMSWFGQCVVDELLQFNGF